jgi:hypothetical protein
MPKDFVVTAVAQNDYANFLGGQADGGAGAGLCVIYDDNAGGIPATPETAKTGNELVKIPLADPAFGAAAAGIITLNAPPAAGVATGAGTATYFRVYSSADGSTIVDPTNCIYQGTAGEAADTPDMVLSKKLIAVDDEITINSLTIDVAESVNTIP